MFTKFSNIFVPIILEKYKAVEDNIEQMRLCAILPHAPQEVYLPLILGETVL
jgi:hypothetical protein